MAIPQRRNKVFFPLKTFKARAVREDERVRPINFHPISLEERMNERRNSRAAGKKLHSLLPQLHSWCRSGSIYALAIDKKCLCKSFCCSIYLLQKINRVWMLQNTISVFVVLTHYALIVPVAIKTCRNALFCAMSMVSGKNEKSNGVNAQPRKLTPGRTPKKTQDRIERRERGMR